MNFLTVSGEAATRVSPTAVSTGIKSMGKIVMPPTEARLGRRRIPPGSFLKKQISEGC